MTLGEFFNIGNPPVFLINLTILSLTIGALFTFLLALKFRKNLQSYAVVLKFIGEAGQYLGLMGTMVSLLSNVDTFAKLESFKDAIPAFLGAWSSTLMGMVTALISSFFITLIVETEKENSS